LRYRNKERTGEGDIKGYYGKSLADKHDQWEASGEFQNKPSSNRQSRSREGSDSQILKEIGQPAEEEGQVGRKGTETGRGAE